MSEPTAPRVAGRYRIEAEIARGGMAVVYRALDEAEGRIVVLKRLRPDLRDRPDVAALFRREYQTLAQISHPRIIEVYEYGVDADGPYYSMELLDGQDLRELAPVPWREACGYLRDVAHSLALLHTRRLLHRDLSPRNVRRTSNGRVKLLDFGTMASFGVPRDVVGTAPLVPPEALRGVALDHRADLYALGALAYYLLTGKHAYASRTIEDLPAAWQRAPTPPAQLVPSIPKPLDDLVLSLLSMDPAARPAHAAEVIERLDALWGQSSEEIVQVAHSYLLSSQLVGREREMKWLEQTLSRALEGHGNTVLVEGNPGVGRTRLLMEVSLRAQVAGALVVGATAERGSEAYDVLRALTRGLLRAAQRDVMRAAAPYLPVLLHEMPELRDEPAPTGLHRRPSLEPGALEEDPTMRRARAQAAWLAFLVDLSTVHPLVLSVDDLHRADEASAMVLAALAHQAPAHKLLLVCSLKLGSPVAAPDALRALRSGSTGLRLHRLGRADTRALVQSVFGSVPNVERIGEFIHDVTTGTATQIMELVRHMVDDGSAKYAGGLWVLPSQTAAAVPESLTQTLSARLSQLTPQARAIASAMSVSERPISAWLLRELWPETTPAEIAQRIEELTRKGVIESGERGLWFVHDAMRDLVLAQVSAEDKPRHHLHLGRVLLDRGAPEDRLYAGLHMMAGGDEMNGARVFADASRSHVAPPRIGEVEGLERALEIYERKRLSKSTAVRMRVKLVRAGYTTDRTLAYRYGPSTLQNLRRQGGLSQTAALSPWLGAKLALGIGLTLAFLRWRLLPPRFRGLHPASAVRQFCEVLAALAGAMSLGVDITALRELMQQAAPLLAFPARHATRPSYLLCEALTALASGREHVHRHAARELIALAEDPSACKGLSERDRDAILEGALLALGVCEAFYADGRGLEVSERLATIPSQFAQVGSHRVELVHHLMRGERAIAEERRRGIELQALRFEAAGPGTALWSTAMEALVTLLADDHLQAKQLIEVLHAELLGAPSLSVYEELLRARAQRRHGQLAGARARIVALCEQLPPREHAGWDAARHALADVLLASGDAAGTEALTRETLANYAPQDELHVVRVMTARLHALAIARLGRLDEARSEVAALLTRIEPTGHCLLLARLHEAALELELLAQDGDAALRHLHAMEAAVEPTANPALLALLHSAAQSTRELVGEPRLGSVPPPDLTEPVTAVSSSPGRRKKPTPR